jgi:hypothetical protein
MVRAARTSPAPQICGRCNLARPNTPTWCRPYNIPKIRLTIQVRNPIQVSVVNNATVISIVANMRPRFAFAAVDAPATLCMIFDLTRAQYQ